MSHDEFAGDELSGAFSLPTLYNLVYCSRAVDGIDKAEVDRIVAIAQRRNAVVGITGLWYSGAASSSNGLKVRASMSRS